MGQTESKVDTISLQRLYDSQLEKELVVRDLQFIRRRANEVSVWREQFNWQMMGAVTTVAVLVVAGSLMKRRDFVIPVVPIVMGVGYCYDKAYGDNLDTVRANAERILNEKPTLARIGPPITVTELDRIREFNRSI